MRSFMILSLLCPLAAAAVDYPATPEEVSATLGRWTIWDTQDNVPFRRHISWPVAEGGPIPGLDPRYAFLLEVAELPPEIDGRLQSIPVPCPETIDLAEHTITTVCTAQVRPAAELRAACENEAQRRIRAALDAYGLHTLSDSVLAIALLQAARKGQVLTADQEAWLDAVSAVGLAYIGEVREAQSALDLWIDTNPGEIPDIGPLSWPALPEGVTLSDPDPEQDL